METVFMTAAEVRAALAQVFDEHGAKADWSRENNVGRSTLTNIISADGPISAAIAKKLGFEKVTRYIAIGRGA
jgi:hypothetical protein